VPVKICPVTDKFGLAGGVQGIWWQGWRDDPKTLPEARAPGEV
jgi:hypothetical protein